MNLQPHEWLLAGLDGGHPLAFLAALGTLRAATLAWPAEPAPTLRWSIAGGAWRPVLAVPGLTDRETLVAGLHAQLKKMEGHPAFNFADDLNIDAESFGAVSREAASQIRVNDRVYADFIAAFGSDTADSGKRDSKNMRATLFRLLGGGQTTFFSPLREIVRDTEKKHIASDLFVPWEYANPVEKHSMRWDPQDDVRHALRWREPSGDPTRKKRGAVWGANRLAIEGLPLFPVQARGKRLETTGFTDRQREGSFFTWPVWEGGLSLEVVRSVVSLPSLHEEKPARPELIARGIVEVYRCQRIRNDNYFNFTPASPA